MFGKHCLSLPFLSNKTESNLRSSLPNVWNCAHSLDRSDDWQQKGADRLPEAVTEHRRITCAWQLKQEEDHTGASIIKCKSYSSFWMHCSASLYQLSRNPVHPASIQLLKLPFVIWMPGEWHTMCCPVPSVSIFYSHTILLHFKSLYVCAPRGGPAVPDLVKFRWNDRAREGGVRILYVYRFRWFRLFMFFKHSAAKPLQKSLSVFSLHVLRTMIHLFMNKTETTTCICMWAVGESDIFTLSPGTRVYFGWRKTWINSVIWMLFITSQHIFFLFSKHATALVCEGLCVLGPLVAEREAEAERPLLSSFQRRSSLMWSAGFIVITIRN